MHRMSWAGWRAHVRMYKARLTDIKAEGNGTMKLFEARDAIAVELDDDDYEMWSGLGDYDRNEFAQPLAYGDLELNEAVQVFRDWTKN